MIVGCNRDGLGPLMMFGLGGTLVELLKDVQFRLAPMWLCYWNTAPPRLYSKNTGVRNQGVQGAGRLSRQAEAGHRRRRRNDSPHVGDGRESPRPPYFINTALKYSAECDINPLIVHAEGKGCSVAIAG